MFTGSSFSEEDTNAITGTIKSVSFKASDNSLLMTISGLALGANTVFADLVATSSFTTMMSTLLRGNDTITGTSGADYMVDGANAGNDKIYGLAGNDVIYGSAGSNTLDGGTGTDVLSFSTTYDDHTAIRGITLNIGLGTVTNSWGGKDTIKNFEIYEGSKFNDTITGSAKADIIRGLGGRDTIDGAAGIDEVRYNLDTGRGGTLGIDVDLALNAAGANAGYGTVIDGFGRVDRIRNVEVIWGTDVADDFTGDGKANTFRGGFGQDRYDGGLGTDTLDLRGFDGTNTFGANVDLRASIVNDDGYGHTEIAVGIESIRGTEKADTITLGADRGTAWGGGGNDTLGTGSTTSAQKLNGGEGADVFVFMPGTTTSASATTTHLIEDFDRDEGDKLDLFFFGPYTLLTNADFLNDGQRRVGYTIDNAAGITSVLIDYDGNGAADYEIQIKATIQILTSDLYSP